ncbi:MAG: hypothetical protein K1X29_02515 [Bdellovibrionales bacterium]|nr:hypothetical protein [Bdellovibrionales bacterium]
MNILFKNQYFFKFPIIFLFYFLHFLPHASAQETVETTVEIVEKTSIPLTQKALFDRAIKSLSHKYILETIGEAKATKNQRLIQQNILSQSGKFILFIKSLPSQIQGEETHYRVSLKISTKTLHGLLLAEGLLYQSDGLPVLLPMVTLVDLMDSQSYSWWTSDHPTGVLSEMTSHFHQSLRTELRPKGFFSLNPVSSNSKNLLPLALQIVNPSQSDLLLLAEFFRSQIIARGQVTLSQKPQRKDSYRLDVRLSALHTSNGRVIAEVNRTYDSEPGPLHLFLKTHLDEIYSRLLGELGAQMQDTWKSGTFGANLLRIDIIGKLSYQQLNQIKGLLTQQVKELKNLKERRFEPNKASYEFDSTANAEQLAQNIKNINFDRFKVQVTQLDTKGVQLKVVAR